MRNIQGLTVPVLLLAQCVSCVFGLTRSFYLRGPCSGSNGAVNLRFVVDLSVTFGKREFEILRLF